MPGHREAISLKTKKLLADRAFENRQLWLKERAAMKKVYDNKTKQLVQPEPNWGYVTKTTLEFFPKLQHLHRDVSTSLCVFFLQLCFLKTCCWVY